jgi:preprotein translocase subunit YajC
MLNTFLQAAQPQQPSPWSFYIMLALILVVMWLFMFRPESKRRKEMQKFRDGLKKGDKIVTAGGIYGTVKEIKETTLLIEVDSNVTLRIDKNMVVADASELK